MNVAVDDSDAIARAAVERLRASDRSGPSLGVELLELRTGFARVAMRIRAEMLNGHGIVHGGFVFALADTALAYAANSRNQQTVTQQASIVFLTPARESEVLIAQAVERASASRSGIYDVDVQSTDGRVVATLQGLTRTNGQPVIPGPT